MPAKGMLRREVPVFAERKMLRFALTLHRRTSIRRGASSAFGLRTTGQRFDGKEPTSPAFRVVIFLSNCKTSTQRLKFWASAGSPGP